MQSGLKELGMFKYDPIVSTFWVNVMCTVSRFL